MRWGRWAGAAGRRGSGLSMQSLGLGRRRGGLGPTKEEEGESEKGGRRNLEPRIPSDGCRVQGVPSDINKDAS